MSNPSPDRNKALSSPKKSEVAKGTVLRISGTVIDVQFSQQNVPSLLNQVVIILPENLQKTIKKKEISLEVAQHLGDGITRCIALEPLEGIPRGLEVIDTQNPIMAPVGKAILGRV
ncbi:MAG: hypothetical protein V1855_03165, partial [bacterium]